MGNRFTREYNPVSTTEETPKNAVSALVLLLLDLYLTRNYNKKQNI